MIDVNKIKDDRALKPKAYEDIDHNHGPNPTRLQSVKCQRCKFNSTEAWLQNYIRTTDNDATNSNNKLLSHVQVMRGKFDDVMGVGISWL